MRVIASVCLIIAFLFAGAFHTLIDREAAIPSGVEVSIGSVATIPAGTDSAIVADHHCHGCFAVSISTPLAPSTVISSDASPSFPLCALVDGITSSIEPPPPRFLT
jgi:hypothetical protein